MVKQEKGWGPEPLHRGRVRHGLLPGPTTSHHQQEAQVGGKGAGRGPQSWSRARPGHGHRAAASAEPTVQWPPHCLFPGPQSSGRPGSCQAARVDRALGGLKESGLGVPNNQGRWASSPRRIGMQGGPERARGNADRAGLVTPESTPGVHACAWAQQ